MKKVPSILVVLLLSVFCFGQTCPEQTWMPTDSVPFAYDPNQVHLDEFTGERAVLGFLIGDTGRELLYDGYGCDEDGNAMVFSVTKGVLEQPVPEVFTWRWTPVSVGVDYVHISVSDVPAVHQESLTRTGTLVILATRPNRPPVLCGGRP
jgi:hypothetical protein